MSEQLSILDAAAEPSRTSGTCTTCGQGVALRPPMNGAPYPALTLPHDSRRRDRRDQPLRCDGMHQVPREWQAWLQADAERWAAYSAEFEAWLSSVTGGAR